ncbi:MAG: reverse transcriptase family protein [Nevskia sp.]|nr:reverse transcriptase family protein [Nevskia sp.]
MMLQDQVAAGLADALLAGPCSEEDFAARAAVALGRKHRWIRPLARRVFQRFGSQLVYAQRRELIQFIRVDPGYGRAWEASTKPRIRRYLLASPPMGVRIGVLAGCVLPELPTPGDLAAWLGIAIPELEWYADLRGMIRWSDGALCHYRYKWIPKRHGDYRLIESPKAALCAIQRKILREILDPVPPHQAAHGFRRGHSCLTYVAPHVGKRVVLRMDLRNFFGSIPAGRINAVFKTLGYPEATARVLTGLCTNRIPVHAALKSPGADQGYILPWPERKKLSERHLPQGAPTSPALANLCALHLDFRLAALAASMDADYTRYADDLAFSGDEPVRRRAERLSVLVAAVALDEGFEVNFRKTRIMHKSDCQILTGVVVNDKTNLHRKEYDRLKATLHNCLRLDPASQNRDGYDDFRAHLQGRVNHLKRLNPSRGAKLQVLLERIDW